jgi:hypothetical protein
MTRLAAATCCHWHNIISDGSLASSIRPPTVTPLAARSIALAELGQLVGWACYDTGQHRLAQRYYIVGLRAAHAADDRPLGAHILGEMAYQAAHQGRPAEAVTLIDTAVAGTRGQ